MNTKIWRALVMSLATAAMITFTACGDSKQEQGSVQSNGLDSIKQRGELVVGVFGDKPPFGYVDAQGANVGFDIVIAKQIAKDLLGDENKIKFVIVEAANRVEFLRSNKVDVIMANFTKTPQREEVVDFAKPYMKVSLGVVSKDGVITDVA